MPTSASHIPTLIGLGSSAHRTLTELRQFLLFSIPQCFSNIVVVNTTPRPSPLRPAQFSRDSSHMHRNSAVRGKNTPYTPPHVAGTAARATPRGGAGGIDRGDGSTRPGSSCASSSASVSASAPDTVPRGSDGSNPSSSPPPPPP